MHNNILLNLSLEKANKDSISENLKLLGLKFYEQVPQKDIKSHLYEPILKKSIEF